MDKNFNINNDFIQSVIEKQLSDIDEQESEEELDFNPLQLYFGDNYTVNNKIVITQPNIQNFIDYGEKAIYSTIAPFTSNTTSYRVQLWNMGIDWNKITNFELFAMLIKTIDIKYSKIIFGDIDFNSFNLYMRHIGEKDVLTLYSPSMDMEITQDDHHKMFKYMCYMFNTFPEEEFTRSKKLKQELINNDKLKIAKRMKEANSSSLLSMISFALNHPGFKYKKNELREVGIVEFMDSIQRLQIYESTHALFGGMYSGFCDTKKINKNEFNFMRDVRISA